MSKTLTVHASICVAENDGDRSVYRNWHGSVGSLVREGGEIEVTQDYVRRVAADAADRLWERISERYGR